MNKFGGNLGQMGCVGFLFTQKGVIVVDLEDKDPDARDDGRARRRGRGLRRRRGGRRGHDFADNFTAVCDALQAKGYEFISADVAQVPATTTALGDADQMANMAKLLDALEDDDDVQNVWHNLENEDELDR